MRWLSLHVQSFKVVPDSIGDLVEWEIGDVLLRGGGRPLLQNRQWHLAQWGGQRSREEILVKQCLKT